MLGPWQPADVAETKSLFERIRAAHAHLHMILDTEPQRVDLEMTIPEQHGLSFPLRLHQQGDELHLEAGEHFRLEFFPGYERQVEDRYFDAVDGLLAGRYRIVEHYRGGRAVKIHLSQRSEDIRRKGKTFGARHV